MCAGERFKCSTRKLAISPAVPQRRANPLRRLRMRSAGVVRRERSGGCRTRREAGCKFQLRCGAAKVPVEDEAAGLVVDVEREELHRPTAAAAGPATSDAERVPPALAHATRGAPALILHRHAAQL